MRLTHELARSRVRGGLVLATFAAVLIAYRFIGIHTLARSTPVTQTWLDERLPWVPELAWVYLVYYGFLLWVFLKACERRDFASWYTTTLSIVGATFLAFLLWPTRIDRLELEPSGAGAGLLAILWEFDPPTNCVPSLHISLTIWAGYVGCSLRMFGRGYAVLAWLAMTASALFTRQHLIADVVGGTVLGLGAVWAAIRCGMLESACSPRERSLAAAMGSTALPFLAAVVPLAVGPTFALEAWSLTRQDPAERLGHRGHGDVREHEACARARAVLGDLTRLYASTPELPMRRSTLGPAQVGMLERLEAALEEQDWIEALRKACACGPPLADAELRLLQDLVLRTLASGVVKHPDLGWLLTAMFLGRSSVERIPRALGRLDQGLRRIVGGSVGDPEAGGLRAQVDPVLEWLSGPVPQGWLLAAWVHGSDSNTIWEVMLRREWVLERQALLRDRASRLAEPDLGMHVAQGEGAGPEDAAAALLRLRRLASFCRVALAISAFRGERGRWPTSIEEAQGAFENPFPTLDPLTGQPLWYTGGSLEMGLVAPRLGDWAPELRWPR